MRCLKPSLLQSLAILTQVPGSHTAALSGRCCPMYLALTLPTSVLRYLIPSAQPCGTQPSSCFDLGLMLLILPYEGPSQDKVIWDGPDRVSHHLTVLVDVFIPPRKFQGMQITRQDLLWAWFTMVFPPGYTSMVLRSQASNYFCQDSLDGEELGGKSPEVLCSGLTFDRPHV